MSDPLAPSPITLRLGVVRRSFTRPRCESPTVGALLRNEITSSESTKSKEKHDFYRTGRKDLIL